MVSSRSPMLPLPATLGELRASGWVSVPVRQELRRNAVTRIRSGEPLFDDVLGYQSTVVPQIENALLAGHDMIMLGERGQAKTRMIRGLIGLLDEWLPVVAGSEICDDPYAPVSAQARAVVADQGDDTPIEWMHRSDRYGEKLATPDTSIADLIGEVDPIKVAEGRYLADEFTLHYGLVPRSNRGIFAINELPDLAERIQVGLLNVLEERDVQIRGHKVRLPLDVVLVASANPEDYTNRGRIITPLKDRFGAQVRTHYPLDADTEIAIVNQEAFPVRTAAAPTGVAADSGEAVAQSNSDVSSDTSGGVAGRAGVAVGSGEDVVQSHGVAGTGTSGGVAGRAGDVADSDDAVVQSHGGAGTGTGGDVAERGDVAAGRGTSGGVVGRGDVAAGTGTGVAGRAEGAVGVAVIVPTFMTEIVVALTRAARDSPHVSQRSGVSVRLSISNQETLVANAIRRTLRAGGEHAVPRVTDLDSLVASTAGKVEIETLEEGRDAEVLQRLLDLAVLSVFKERVPPRLHREVVEAFEDDLVVDVGEDVADTDYVSLLQTMPALSAPVQVLLAGDGGSESPAMIAAAVEFVLEGLHLSKRLNKDFQHSRAQFRSR